MKCLKTFFVSACFFLNGIYFADTADAAPRKAAKNFSFRSVVIDPDTTSNTTPIGISKKGELLLKSATEASTKYLLRSASGAFTDLSSMYPGLAFLDISATGVVLTGPKTRLDGACVVYVGDVVTATAGAPLTEVVLQGATLCNSALGKIAATNLFALLLEGPSGPSPIPQQLIVFSKGTFSVHSFTGNSPGNLDTTEVLAGFRSGGVVTNFVDGSTTPNYTSVAFGPSGTQTIKFPINGPSVVGFLLIKRFINNETILSTNDFSGCGSYVVRAERNSITDIKRILRKGACTVASSINAEARAVGCAFSLTKDISSCEAFYWDRESRFNPLPEANRILKGASWTSVDGINDRNQIFGVITTADKRSRTVLLSPKR